MRSHLAVLLLILATTASAAAPSLYRLDSGKQPAENGKVLDIRVAEVERNTDTSTIEVTRTSGGSVSSSMFLLRGVCGLARERGKAYFRAVRIADARYRIEFPETVASDQVKPANPRDKVFSLEECQLMGY